MARPKNKRPTKLASGRIIASRHEYLVAKYGSIAAALNHLWAIDTMPAPAASQQAPAQPQAQPQPTIDQLLTDLLAEMPGKPPPMY